MIEECYTYTIMPDFGNAAYAWVRGPGEIRCGVGGNMADYTGWYGDHLISKLLESDLAEWALEFEKNVNVYGNDLCFDWESYHIRGLALARRLKAELGPEVKVRYVKPCEDPDSEINACTEVLLDFDPPKSATVPLELHELSYGYKPKEKELEFIDAAGNCKSTAILCYFYALAGNTYSPGWILNRVSDDVIFKTASFCVQGKESFTDYFLEWFESSDNHARKRYELGSNTGSGGLCVIEHTKHEITDYGIGRQTHRIDIEADLNGDFKVISIVAIDSLLSTMIGARLFPGISDDDIRYELSYEPKNVVFIAGYAYPCVYGENGDGELLTEYFGDIPNIIEIEAAFEKWAAWYNAQKEDLMVFPWDEFNRQGIALAKRLYQAIRHTGFEISYWKSCKEPGADPFKKLLITDES